MKIGKKYMIVIDAGERTLTYTVTVIDEDENFYKIEDRNGEVLSISKIKLVSFKEI